MGWQVGAEHSKVLILFYFLFSWTHDYFLCTWLYNVHVLLYIENNILANALDLFLVISALEFSYYGKNYMSKNEITLIKCLDGIFHSH